MKKVFILLLAVFMCACTHTIKDIAKVVKVEYANSNNYTYKITVLHCDTHAFDDGRLHILTNHKYNIGDTIHIVKK
jgi:hypothetical protein